MKKYIKPELFYESYELSQHIANCQWEIQQADENTCIAKGEAGTIYEENTLFTTGMSCQFTTDNGVWEDYCYHSGQDGHMNVFAS